MRAPEILLILFVAFLFFLAKPGSKKNRIVRREQQEYSDSTRIKNAYRVTYQVLDLEQEDISDINWLIKAAQIAVNEGLPYFNVLEQTTHKRFSPRANREMTVIEGTIQLLPDPMSTDYDANEILSLNLGQ